MLYKRERCWGETMKPRHGPGLSPTGTDLGGSGKDSDQHVEGPLVWRKFPVSNSGAWVRRS